MEEEQGMYLYTVVSNEGTITNTHSYLQAHEKLTPLAEQWTHAFIEVWDNGKLVHVIGSEAKWQAWVKKQVSANEERKRLWRFYWDCGRMGSLDSIFVATKTEVEAAIGKILYFVEVLGKHSEIDGLLEPTDLTEITVDESVILTLVPILGETWSGHNPLHYVQGDL
jgi:hypothetical protein